MKRSTNSVEVKRQNRNRVFRYVNGQAETSMPEISATLDISGPTVLTIVNELKEEGVLKEAGELKSTGGRKAKAIAAVKDIKYAVGIDLTANHIGITYTDLSEKALKHVRIRKSFEYTNEYLDALAVFTRRFIEENAIPEDKILGIGISMPCIIDKKEQRQEERQMQALIYIVEDDMNIQEIEMFALKNTGYVTEGFANAKSFFSRMTEKIPDLILLDIMLPDQDGLEIVRKLRERPETVRVPIILVTAKTTELDKVKGLDIGADDYLTKPFGVMELISRVKALLRRSKSIQEDQILRLKNVTLDSEKRIVHVNDIPCELTFKEFELLKLLMINAGIVLRREVIMMDVWGTDYEGESRTLDMHIKTLRQKLGDAGNMIKTVRNVGYKME